MFYTIVTILAIIGGLLAASSFIAKKSQDAGKALKKLAPYQGVIGIILLVFGLYYFLFKSLPHLGVMVKYSAGLFGLIMQILMILVGFILSYNLLAEKLLSKSETAQEKGAQAAKKLTSIQIPLGIALSVCAFLALIL
ncbi:hypothetical protein [Kangiella sediminilitoris]|uniref:DUF4149 domain-containing protein n=1 Tax=Kangiella sediminilitoris TaxID=1144748 RepID=A0A1B3B958_9GAMM|nr:hypothetical protein [Kangiella sediminilitoris]AOE49338.1 hypothetical protein KS2013_614 [Kangiella sediminilitoris]